MSNLFDHLSERLQDDNPGGMSPVDLADLPGDQKQLLLSLLREPASSFEGVTATMLHAKLDGKITQIDALLNQCVREGWLIVLGEPPKVSYRLNFRAKRGSTSRFNLWSVLTDRLPTDWKGAAANDAT